MQTGLALFRGDNHCMSQKVVPMDLLTRIQEKILEECQDSLYRFYAD